MRKGACKHFNGIQHKVCPVGVDYQSLPKVETKGLNLPCLCKNGGEYCSKYEEPTDEEVASHEAVVEAAMDRMLKTIPWASSMKKKHPKGGSGADSCPICKGKIHYAVSSYNLHIRAQCETEDCVNFME